MPSIPELLNGLVTLEVEYLDRLYLNGYIGPLATSGGLVTFLREQLGKPIPSPVVLGQVTEKFREAVKAMAEQHQIPLRQFDHQERKDDVANQIRRQRGVKDGIVFIGVAQEKAQAFQGKKVDGQFQFTRDKTVYVIDPDGISVGRLQQEGFLLQGEVQQACCAARKQTRRLCRRPFSPRRCLAGTRLGFALSGTR